MSESPDRIVNVGAGSVQRTLNPAGLRLLSLGLLARLALSLCLGT